MFPQPQYLGNKHQYVAHILSKIPEDVNVVIDAFSGSSVVGYHMKKKGYEVHSIDFLKFNYHIACSLVENATSTIEQDDLENLVRPNESKGDFLEREYSGLYYNAQECSFLDNLSMNIRGIVDKHKQSLAYAIACRTLTRKILFGYFCHTKGMDYRDDENMWKRNSAIQKPIEGVFKSFVADYNNAVFDNGKENKSYHGDVLNIIHTIPADLAYFDPPYAGRHSDYQQPYHFLETFVNYWDDATLYNRTKMPKDKFEPSLFSSKKTIHTAIRMLFQQSKHIKYWLLSYNSKAYPCKNDLLELIREFKLNIIEHHLTIPHNNGGMGQKKDSCEYLFLCY
jgi:adenine-specific DNA-methyltransferase